MGVPIARRGRRGRSGRDQTASRRARTRRIEPAQTPSGRGRSLELMAKGYAETDSAGALDVLDDFLVRAESIRHTGPRLSTCFDGTCVLVSSPIRRQSRTGPTGTRGRESASHRTARNQTAKGAQTGAYSGSGIKALCSYGRCARQDRGNRRGRLARARRSDRGQPLPVGRARCRNGSQGERLGGTGQRRGARAAAPGALRGCSRSTTPFQLDAYGQKSFRSSCASQVPPVARTSTR